MKRKIWTNLLLGAAFAFVLSVSAVGCLVTGYDLEVTSITAIFLWCACCSLISALLFGFKFGNPILLFLFALVSPAIWQRGALWEQLQSLAFTISSHYHDVYNWPILGKSISDEVSLPLMVLSAWAAISVSWTFCRRKHIIILAPSVILPLVICLITTDRVPDEIYLYLLILGVTLLLATDWTRRENPAQGIKLTLRLLIPFAAAFAVLFAVNPRNEYVNNAGKYQKEVISWFQKLQDTTEAIGSGVSFESAVSKKLNLRYVGPKSNITHSVMRVNSPIDGIIYLRGRDYDIYSGTGWESTQNRKEAFTSCGVSSGDLTIVTYGVRDVLYVPYYTTNVIHLTAGAADNDENLQTYSHSLSRTHDRGTEVPDSHYTELPTATRHWASQLAGEITSGADSQAEIIPLIQSYVRNSAVYNLDTSRMDSQYDDFAKWFLEDSDTGYCVHFATAAAVLLRAAGIPARYVEGYMVTCKAAESIVVSSRDAHAWVEYYDANAAAWCVLEATPADLQEEGTDDAIITTSPATEPTAPSTAPYTTETEFTNSKDVPDNLEKPPVSPEIAPDGTDAQPTQQDPLELPDWLNQVFWIMPAVALIPLQSYIRIVWKQKRWDHGQPNETALIRWKQTKILARQLRIPYPEELDALAQKATFSQHRIQPEELQLFEDYREHFLESVSGTPWYKRAIYHWIFAIRF